MSGGQQAEGAVGSRLRGGGPAAVQTVVPSGDCAMWSTREVWPVSSATRTIDGYFHRMSWLCE